MADHPDKEKHFQMERPVEWEEIARTSYEQIYDEAQKLPVGEALPIRFDSVEDAMMFVTRFFLGRTGYRRGLRANRRGPVVYVRKARAVAAEPDRL